MFTHYALAAAVHLAVMTHFHVAYATTNAFSLVVPGTSVPIWAKSTSRKITVWLKTPTETLAAYEQAVIDFKAKTTMISTLDTVTKNPMAKSVLHVKRILTDMHMYLDNVEKYLIKIAKFSSSLPPPAHVPDAQCDIPVTAPFPKKEVEKFTDNVDRQIAILKKNIATAEAATTGDQAEKDKIKLDHLESFILAMEIHLNLVIRMSASLEEYLQMAEHLSNTAIHSNLIFVLTMKGCLDVAANEIVDVDNCGAYTEGYHCALTISRLDQIGPAYKALEVPYYHEKTDRVWILDVGDILVNIHSNQFIDKGTCTLDSGGYVCTGNPWVDHECLKALESANELAVKDYCELKNYPAKIPLVLDTELGLLLAKRDKGEIQISWTKSDGVKTTFDLKTPVILTGFGEVKLKDDWRLTTRIISQTLFNDDGSDERILPSILDLTWLVPPNFGRLGGKTNSTDHSGPPALWEEPVWEFVQIGLTMFIALLALCGLPCCFLYTRDKFEKRQKKKKSKELLEQFQQGLPQDIEMNFITKRMRKQAKTKTKTRRKDPHDAVQGFLEEFVPKPNNPYHKGGRFSDVE